MEIARTIIQQRVCVQMENFHNHLTKILFDEFQVGDSCDLIIKTGPEKHENHCHKMILAFSSDFLQSILKNIPSNSTPVLLMPDINTEIMDYLMVFMYGGEVSIPIEKYSHFIEVCKMLQLKGIPNLELEEEQTESQEFQEEEMSDQDVESQEQDEIDESEKSAPITFMNDDVVQSDSEYANEVIEHELVSEFIEEEPNAVFQVEKSKVRIKSDYLENPFNTSQVFRIPNANINFISKKHAMPQISKSKEEPRLKTPQKKIKLNDSNATHIRERLISAVSGVYKSFDQNVQNVSLVIEDNKLQKGVYQCPLCQKMISVVYTVDKKGNFRQWVNSNLKRHILRVHLNKK